MGQGLQTELRDDIFRLVHRRLGQQASRCMSLWHYPVLFLTGIIAGLVDSTAGGGGIITVPVLLNFGLPVPLALGTNKLQSSFGSVSAAWHYSRAGVVKFRDCRLGIVMTLIGAALGALTVELIDSQLLGQLIPWLLGGILLYTLIRPRVGEQDHPPRLPWAWFYTAFGLGIQVWERCEPRGLGVGAVRGLGRVLRHVGVGHRVVSVHVAGFDPLHGVFLHRARLE